MSPPDVSWTCTQGAGSYVRTAVCSHIVVRGDGAAYTFTATSSNGPGILGLIFEASNTISAQTAYSFSSGDSGQNTVTPSPSLVPSVPGMLPVAVTVGGQAATSGSAGWTTLLSTPGMSIFAAGATTTSTSTSVSTTFHFPSNNVGNTLQTLLLLAPGIIVLPPSVSPAAGTYASAQTVSLADVAPGAVVHYTLDGSTPTCSSTPYNSGILLTSSMVLSSIACAPGYANSAVVTSPFIIAAGTLQGISLGPLGDLHGYVPSAGDAFHTPINTSPVDPNSAKIIANIGAGHLHHDWSSVNGGNYGIPYTVVDSTQTPLVPFVNQLYTDESDPSVYPIPTGMPIESNPPNCQITGDNHAIMFDKHTGVEYEFYQAQYCPGHTPAWQASNGVMWDTTINEKRPYTYTSVDAAGLSIFEGLVRYDEIAAGAINHALRFTTTFTRCDHYDYGDGQGAFVAPATHAACNNSGSLNIMGMRIRLNANFDISGYSPTNQIILQAMKTYGMILADNGSSLYYQGTPDPRWNDNDLSALDQVLASNLEVVLMPPIMTNDSYPSGTAPVIKSFTPSQTTITLGESVTLNASLTGASYSYVDKAGFMRDGSVTTTPTATTTYLLTVRNAFGEVTATTTVNVISSTQTSSALQLSAVPAKTFGTGAFTVSATSLSSAPILYAVTSGPATISGNQVTLTGTGTVVIAATQVAFGNYTAGQATVSFTVAGEVPTLSFAPVANVSYGAATFTVQANSNSTGAISYSVLSGPATLSNGNSVSVNAVGTVTLQATQAAAGNFSSVVASTSFTVSPVASTLAMTPIPNQTLGAAPFAVSCTSNSNGGNTYSVVSGPATISGNIVTLTNAGTVTIGVQQAAAGNYKAGTATTTFAVTAPVVTLQAPQITILTLAPIATQILGAKPFQVTATSNSNAEIVYAVASGPATVSGNTVTLTGTGVVKLVAVQAPTKKYGSAMSLTSFAVVKR